MKALQRRGRVAYMLRRPAVRVGYVVAMAVALLPAQTGAVTITSVSAPNMTRALDGVAHPFTALVGGTYSALDIAFGAAIPLSAQYWDQDRFVFDFANPDDPIDTTATLTVPAPGPADVAGSAWGPVPVSFSVGCTPGQDVFGPSGNTGESDMDDGYFYFPGAVAKSWGYNRVLCLAGNNSNGAMIAMGLLSVDDIPPLLPGGDEVPLPASVWLIGSGAIGLLVWARRRARMG